MSEKEQLRNPNPRRDRLLNFAAYGTLLLMLGGCVGSWATHRREVNPTASVTDFESYLRDMRAPSKIEVMRVDGRPVLVATGTLSKLAWLSIPSGPPQYLFDTTGKLQDWTSDCGEGKGWRAGTSTPLIKSVTLPEARVWLTEQQSPNPSPP